MKLHLGCGRVILPGFVNVDFVQLPGVDRVVDLTVMPWPWGTDSVDHIEAHHFFEHVPFMSTFSEVYRILKPGGTVHLEVPYLHGPVWLCDPTHVTHFSYDTFTNWDPSVLEDRAQYGLAMRWVPLRRRIHFMFPCSLTRRVINGVMDFPVNLFPRLFERFLSGIFLYNVIEFTLQKPR